MVELEVRPELVELASADLYDLDTVGIEEVGTGDQHLRGSDGTLVATGCLLLRAGFASVAAAEEAAHALDPAWRARALVLAGDEWMDAWREHFTPVRAGHLIIVPSWKDDIAMLGDPVLLGMGRGDITLHLDPGRSFGTGAHPSTLLVLEAMQDDDMAIAGASVLDVGCGSGILAVGAALLGAASAIGVDVEDAALRTTMANAADNGVAARVSVLDGGIDAVTGTFDLVLANILAPVLRELAAPIAARVAPGGRLVLSGFVAEQVEELVERYAAHGLRLLHAHEGEGTWRALTLVR